MSERKHCQAESLNVRFNYFDATHPAFHTTHSNKPNLPNSHKSTKLTQIAPTDAPDASDAVSAPGATSTSAGGGRECQLLFISFN